MKNLVMIIVQTLHNSDAYTDIFRLIYINIEILRYLKNSVMTEIQILFLVCLVKYLKFKKVSILNFFIYHEKYFYQNF